MFHILDTTGADCCPNAKVLTDINNTVAIRICGYSSVRECINALLEVFIIAEEEEEEEEEKE